MVSEVINYIGVEGKEVSTTAYFNLTRSEVSEISMEIPGGWEGLQERVESDFKGTFKEYYDIIKMFVAKAYGVKSKDGKGLIKPEEETLKFIASEAYSVIIDKLFSDETGMALQTFMQKVTEGAKLNSKGKLTVVNAGDDIVEDA